MATQNKNKSNIRLKTMKKVFILRIGVLIFAMILPAVVTAKDFTPKRFVYKQISDTVTLPKGKNELNYRFWLEDWDIDKWKIKVMRNDLTYRYGLFDKTEIGINAMHSCCMYWYRDVYWWGTKSGFNDLQFYGKHQILSEPDWPVTVTIGGKLFAPTGSRKGFSAEQNRYGEFVAVSKEFGSWRLAGHLGKIDYRRGRDDNYYWGAGIIEQESGGCFEVFGSGDYLQGLIGITQWTGQGYIQYGFEFPMDGYDMDWRFIFGLGFQF